MITVFRLGGACIAAAVSMGAAFLSFSGQSSTRAVKIPRISGEYVTVYSPAGDRFPGPDTTELKSFQWYAAWVPNDHTIIKGPDNRWHAFGITHPLTSVQRIHEGEFQSFHAAAPGGFLRDGLRDAAWKDLPKVLRATERLGERPEFYAPHVIRRKELYYMFYGPNPIRLATSPDLMSWTPQGALFSEGADTRDPSVMEWQGTYYMVYCTGGAVGLRTSNDLRRWSKPRTILRMRDNVAPESPSIVRYSGTFYLFLCGWNGIWDKKTVQGAYQHKTYVYQSDDLAHFDSGNPLITLEAHAPEVFQGEDGQWYVSTVEWPRRGLSIAKLAWE